MKKSIYIYGASGHGLVVADIAKLSGYDDIIFVDDGENEFLSFDDIKLKNDIPITLGIGDNKIRKFLFNKLLAFKFNIVSLIHPSAIISSSVYIGIGTIVMPMVAINAKTKIGNAVIVNTSSVIDHENIIGDFVHISPNVALAGNIRIEELTHIGIGTNIIQGITIKKECIVGAGSVVVKNIDKNKLAYGNPCKIIKEIGNE